MTRSKFEDTASVKLTWWSRYTRQPGFELLRFVFVSFVPGIYCIPEEISFNLVRFRVDRGQAVQRERDGHNPKEGGSQRGQTLPGIIGLG